MAIRGGFLLRLKASGPAGAADLAVRNPYAVLGVSPAASAAEVKAAYRALVKRHHPDAGGDDRTILELNAAWELLRNGEPRRTPAGPDAPARQAAPSAGAVPAYGGRGPAAEAAVQQWLQQVHAPIDRQLAQVINPFPAQLKALSADPYDDALMASFCAFLEQATARMAKVELLYRSRPCPLPVQAVGLDLYHCLSLVQDALAELERYTMGYVDSYLHDGRELLRQARLRRQALAASRRELGV